MQRFGKVCIDPCDIAAVDAFFGALKRLDVLVNCEGYLQRPTDPPVPPDATQSEASGRFRSAAPWLPPFAVPRSSLRLCETSPPRSNDDAARYP